MKRCMRCMTPLDERATRWAMSDPVTETRVGYVCERHVALARNCGFEVTGRPLGADRVVTLPAANTERVV